MLASTFLVACTSPSDRYPKGEIENICKDTFVKINRTVATSDIYIDRAFLRTLVKPFDETYYLSDVIKFFFQERLRSIETTNEDANGNTLIYKFPRGKNIIVRLSIQPESDERCLNYAYTKEYPAQAYPWLRELGLQPGKCIALEHSSTIQSKIQIKVQEKPIGAQFNGMNWQKKYIVTLSDSNVQKASTAADMSDVYAEGGGGKAGKNFYFPCGWKDAKVREFYRAVESVGNDEIVVPEKIFWSANTAANVSSFTSYEKLLSFKWVAKVGKVNSSNIIDSAGTAWVTWAPKRDHFGYEFNVLKNGKLNSSWIVSSERGMPNLSGLGTTKNGYAVIEFTSFDHPSSNHYLIEFDSLGRQTSTSKLTLEQYQTLERLD